MKRLTINVSYEKLNTKERRTKAAYATSKMEVVINSVAFKNIFIRTLENRDYANGELSLWKDQTPIAIYNHFMSGAETLSPTKDNKMDIDIDDYYTWKRVIGYTYRNISTIFVNTKYFDKRGPKLIGSNICHEYGHKIGWDHDFRRTKRRKDSLCYLLNEIYEYAYDSVYPEEKEPVKRPRRRRSFFRRLFSWIFILS